MPVSAVYPFGPMRHGALTKCRNLGSFQTLPAGASQ